MVSREEVYSALGQVMDPEIHRPITELEMVKSVEIDRSGAVRVEVLLTIPGCPMKDRLNRDVTAAVAPLPGVTAVEVALGSMTEEQRQALVGKLRGPGAQQQRKITFWGDDSATRVLAVASGKGGVGKSSVTVNLAAALAAQGHRGEGHLHRLLHRWPAGGVARPHAAPRHPAVPRGRVLGRPGLRAARPPAGHRRRLDLAGADVARLRDAAGHHPAGGRGAGGDPGGPLRAGERP